MKNVNPKIITFYSYKGGVGRSMALANVAWILSEKFEKRVLIIDWDLDTPGLHKFVNYDAGLKSKGLIDLFCDYKNLLKSKHPQVDDEFINIDKYIVNLNSQISSSGSLSIMPAGLFDNEYAKRVNDFDWEEFYKDWRGYGFVEFLKKQFRKRADLILVDSRAGITDIGGICTLQLTDLVVLLFSLNEQNISGTKTIIKNIINKSARTGHQGDSSNVKYLITPSRVEKYLEKDLRKYWEKKAFTDLGAYLTDYKGPSKYFSTDAIPYIGINSFGESLVVQKHPQGELANSYYSLAIRILKKTDAWVDDYAKFENRKLNIPERDVTRISAVEGSKKMLKYQISIGILCIALGVAVFLAIQNYGNNKSHKMDSTDRLFSQERSMDKTFDSFFNNDFFRSNRSPFDEMKRMQESMMKQFGFPDDDSGSGIFSSWFKKKFGGGDPGDIQMREDEGFVYYDVVIKDLSNKKLDILVEDGQIKIAGTIEEKSEDKGKNESSIQFSSSTFHRSFPVPYGVDSTRAEMERDGDKIIIKLPKVK